MLPAAAAAWPSSVSSAPRTRCGSFDVAWVFSGGTGNLPKSVAEAAAHEIGHTLDLTHDGTTAHGDGSYYPGHAAWAPIMGVGYDQGVTQWSKGDYADANNQQDDVAVIAGQAPLRADDAGGSLNTAARLPSGTANISSRNDIDYYALGTCTGSVTVAAQPAALGANLDIALTIVDSTGNPVAAAAPATTQQQANEPYPWDDQFVYQAAQVTGMDAAVTTTLPAGRYYAAVDGGGARAGGAGNTVTDYDDYASLGGYTLTVAGCTAAEAAVPGPTTMDVTFTAAGLSTTWTAPTDDGGSDLLGFDVTLDGGAPVRVSPDVTSYAWPDVTTGSHTVSVTAVNETGAGQAATSSVRRSLPGAPVLFSTGISTHPNAPDPSVLYFDINWLPPTDDGGSPVLSYRVEYEIRPGVWQLVRELSSDGTYSVNNLGVSLTPGWTLSHLRVIAVNEVGESEPLVVTGQIPGPPMLFGAADMTVTPDKLAHTLRVDWTDPYDGGSPILGTRVGFATPDENSWPDEYPVHDVHDVAAGVHTVTFTDVPAGQHLLAIEAYNVHGARRQLMTVEMPALLPPDQVTEFDPVAVEARHGTATVSWKAPATDPVLPILGYDVTVDSADPVRVTGTTYTLTGLELGSTHSVVVSAVNLAGGGYPYGPPDIRVVTVPAPVTGLQATLDRSVSNNLTVNATWTPSADNGGESGSPEYRWRLQPVAGDGRLLADRLGGILPPGQLAGAGRVHAAGAGTQPHRRLRDRERADDRATAGCARHDHRPARAAPGRRGGHRHRHLVGSRRRGQRGPVPLGHRHRRDHRTGPCSGARLRRAPPTRSTISPPVTSTGSQ